MTKLTSQGYRAGNTGNDPPKRRAESRNQVAIDRYSLDNTIGSCPSEHITRLPIVKRRDLIFNQNEFFVQGNF